MAEKEGFELLLHVLKYLYFNFCIIQKVTYLVTECFELKCPVLKELNYTKISIFRE